MENNERVFVDSNYFIALFNPFDNLHLKARKITEELVREKIPLVISNFIFLETATILSQKRGKEIAIEVGNYFFSNLTIEIVHIDESLQESSWKIFQEIKNKNMSFVDCSNIAVIKAEGISKLLTFDIEDFKKLQKKYRFSLYSLFRNLKT